MKNNKRYPIFALAWLLGLVLTAHAQMGGKIYTSVIASGAVQTGSTNYQMPTTACHSTPLVESSNPPRSTNHCQYSGMCDTLEGGEGAVVFKISASLQGSGRPVSAGWEVPINIGFFNPGADSLSDTPIYEFNLTTSYSNGYAVCQAEGVEPGSYDIAVVGEHTLMSVKRSVVISEPSTAVNMGTLIAGDCNNDGGINMGDFWIFKAGYGTGDPRSDFDLDGEVNLVDFATSKSNYGMASPIEVE